VELAERLSYIACGQLIVIINACKSGRFITKIIDKVKKSLHGPKKTVALASSLKKQLSWTYFLEKCHFSNLKHGALSVYFYAALNWGRSPTNIEHPGRTLPGCNRGVSTGI